MPPSHLRVAAIRNTGIDPNEPVTPQLRRKSKERMERLEPDIRITPVRVAPRPAPRLLCGPHITFRCS